MIKNTQKLNCIICDESNFASKDDKHLKDIYPCGVIIQDGRWVCSKKCWEIYVDTNA